MGNLFFLFSPFRLSPTKTFQFSLVLNDFLPASNELLTVQLEAKGSRDWTQNEQTGPAAPQAGGTLAGGSLHVEEVGSLG